jgi:hypothetical protein
MKKLLVNQLINLYKPLTTQPCVASQRRLTAAVTAELFGKTVATIVGSAECLWQIVICLMESPKIEKKYKLARLPRDLQAENLSHSLASCNNVSSRCSKLHVSVVECSISYLLLSTRIILRLKRLPLPQFFRRRNSF